MSVTDIAQHLTALGYDISRQEIIAVPEIAVEYLSHRYGIARCFIIGDRSLDVGFTAFGHHVTRGEEPVDAVILGLSRWADFGEMPVIANQIGQVLPKRHGRRKRERPFVFIVLEEHGIADPSPLGRVHVTGIELDRVHVTNRYFTLPRFQAELVKAGVGNHRSVDLRVVFIPFEIDVIDDV